MSRAGILALTVTLVAAGAAGARAQAAAPKAAKPAAEAEKPAAAPAPAAKPVAPAPQVQGEHHMEGRVSAVSHTNQSLV
jgi:hypothetical protein